MSRRSVWLEHPRREDPGRPARDSPPTRQAERSYSIPSAPGEECPLRKLDKLPSHALRALIPCGDRLNHVDAAGAPDVGESGVFGTAQSSRAAEGGLRVPRRIAGG